MRRLCTLAILACLVLGNVSCIAAFSVKGHAYSGDEQAVVIDGRVYIVDLDDYTVVPISKAAESVRIEITTTEVEISDD